MSIPSRLVKQLLFCTVVLSLLSSCRDKEKSSPASSDGDYSIFVLSKDEKEYLIETNTLDQGTLRPIEEGVALDRMEIERDIIVHAGHYYYQNSTTGEFINYEIRKDSLHKVSFASLPDFFLENYNWIAVDTLLLTGFNKKFSRMKYALLHTPTMSVVAKGDIGISTPSDSTTTLSLGFTKLHSNKLLGGYTYHRFQDNNYVTSDTLFVATLDYPSMRVLHIQKDTRSTYPGGINTIQPYSFTDEQGDFYFMTCPGILLGNRPETPTAIYRIRHDEEQTDSSYFFSISGSAIQNHAYGMWYAGNGKAIIRSEQKGMSHGWNDYHIVPQFRFHLIDLKTQTVTLIPVPMDKGGRRECVLVQHGVAYIAVNSDTDGNAIWIYDLTNQKLKRGLTLEGEVDYIFRIDQVRE